MSVVALHRTHGCSDLRRKERKPYELFCAKHPQHLSAGPWRQRQDHTRRKHAVFDRWHHSDGLPRHGNTVCDFDPEEIRRQVSISTAVAPVDYKGCKINLLDTPGYFDFSGEVMEALERLRRRRDRHPLQGRAPERGHGKGLELLRGAPHAPHPLHLQDRRGKRGLQRRLRRPAGAVRAEIWLPSSPPSGMGTRRSSASSTFSTSAPMRCRATSGWRSRSPRISSRAG